VSPAELRRVTVLVDTNVIIESVRTGVWNALKGSLRVETVEECREETQRGNPHRPGRVTVSPENLAGLAAVHPVSNLQRAAFALAYPEAPGMDPGEMDLLSHAYSRIDAGDEVWVVSSPDRASIRAGVALGWREHTVALEDLVDAVGGRPRLRMADHFTRAWLSQSWMEYTQVP
jgi:hypothetical protein